MKQLERTLKALANQRRLGILKYLQKQRYADVSSIAEAIDLSIKATSKHLFKMYSTDILERRQRSKLVFYSISSSLPPLAKDVLKHLS